MKRYKHIDISLRLSNNAKIIFFGIFILVIIYTIWGGNLGIIAIFAKVK